MIRYHLELDGRPRDAQPEHLDELVGARVDRRRAGAGGALRSDAPRDGTAPGVRRDARDGTRGGTALSVVVAVAVALLVDRRAVAGRARRAAAAVAAAVAAAAVCPPGVRREIAPPS